MEKDLGVLVGEKLNMSWQFTVTSQTTNHIIDCTKSRSIYLENLFPMKLVRHWSKLSREVVEEFKARLDGDFGNQT